MDTIAAERVGGQQMGWGSLVSKTARDLVRRSRRLEPTRETPILRVGTPARKAWAKTRVGHEHPSLYVKGVRRGLGTLTEAGLAVLQLDRVRQLVNVYPGLEREDEMVEAFDYCTHGKGGAAPSIDTAMHALVDANHVDHLHPDSGIAIATAVDGKELTTKIFGSKVVWVPWRRPGFQLGLDIARIKEKHPEAIGCILGGHGITAWGETSEACEKNSLWIIRTAEKYIKAHGKKEPFGRVVKDLAPLKPAARKARAAALARLSAV